MQQLQNHQGLSKHGSRWTGENASYCDNQLKDSRLHTSRFSTIPGFASEFPVWRTFIAGDPLSYTLPNLDPDQVRLSIDPTTHLSLLPLHRDFCHFPKRKKVPCRANRDTVCANCAGTRRKATTFLNLQRPCLPRMGKTAMAPPKQYDSDSSEGEDDVEYTETNVLLGYASKDPGDDSISRLGGRPVRCFPSHPSRCSFT